MALNQYAYNEGDSAWFATFVARVEKQSKGFIGISLTNYDTSTVCAIAAGSVVEINGAMFICSAVTTITGSITTGLNYIVLSVTGTMASPYFKTAAGTWDMDKQGWYSGNDRYVGNFSSNGLTYDGKQIYEQRELRKVETIRDQGEIARNGLKVKIVEIGDWDMVTTQDKTVAHGLTLAKIRSVSIIVRNDASDHMAMFLNEATGGAAEDGYITDIDAINVSLSRAAGGLFDSIDFDSTSYNRGWVTIWYEA